MKRHVGSSDGIAAALHLSPELTDAEFRLLVLISERPDGECFAADLSYFERKGMASKDAISAAVHLSAVGVFDDPYKGMPGSLFEYYADGRVVWRFF